MSNPYDRLLSLPSPGIGWDASSSARTTVYPPLPFPLRRHPVGQMCWRPGDPTRDPSKDKLFSPRLKVAMPNAALPVRFASSNMTAPVKVASSKSVVPLKVAPPNLASPVKLARKNEAPSGKVALPNPASPVKVTAPNEAPSRLPCQTRRGG